MVQKIEAGRVYKHFKGNLYKIVGIAKHSETEESMIVYESMRNNTLWVRPYKMWNEVVDDNGTLRFTILED